MGLRVLVSRSARRRRGLSAKAGPIATDDAGELYLGDSRGWHLQLRLPGVEAVKRRRRRAT